MKRFLRLLLLLAPMTTHAATLWKTDDQQGAALLKRGDPLHAAKTFKNPSWKAVALYRAGNYEKADTLWQSSQTAQAAYNRGNALAHLGKIEAAIQSYEQCLLKTPHDADAKYNLALLKKMKHQKKPSEKPQKSPEKKPNLSEKKVPKPKHPKGRKESADKLQKTQTQAMIHKIEQDRKDKKLFKSTDEEPGVLLQQLFARDYQRILLTQHMRENQ